MIGPHSFVRVDSWREIASGAMGVSVTFGLQPLQRTRMIARHALTNLPSAASQLSNSSAARAEPEYRMYSSNRMRSCLASWRMHVAHAGILEVRGKALPNMGRFALQVPTQIGMIFDPPTIFLARLREQHEGLSSGQQVQPVFPGFRAESFDCPLCLHAGYPLAVLANDTVDPLPAHHDIDTIA